MQLENEASFVILRRGGVISVSFIRVWASNKNTVFPEVMCVVRLENSSLFYQRDGRRSNVFRDGVFVLDRVCSCLAYSANSYISEPRV